MDAPSNKREDQPIEVVVLEEEGPEKEERPKLDTVEKCMTLTKDRVIKLKRDYQFQKGLKIRIPNSKGWACNTRWTRSLCTKVHCTAYRSAPSNVSGPSSFMLFPQC